MCVCVCFRLQEHIMIIIVITLASQRGNVAALARANGNVMIVALIAGRCVGRLEEAEYTTETPHSVATTLQHYNRHMML